MTEFRTQNLQGSCFVEVDLSRACFDQVRLVKARIRESDLSRARLRAVEVNGLEIDAPWIYAGSLVVNGVDVVPLVEAELNTRYPGRELRQATDPDGLRSAWTAVEGGWARLLDRAAMLPAGSVDVSVDEEWSFAETLRHLVLATDLWLGAAVLGHEDPFHPLGLIHSVDAGDLGPPVQRDSPAYAAVLEARAGRMAMVRDLLGAVTAAELAEPRPNPHDPGFSETVLSCLHTILEEEWEHLRFAKRDLDVLALRQDSPRPALEDSES